MFTPSRTLHVIDIECLAGADHDTFAGLQRASSAYRGCIGVAPGDLAVVGCDIAPQHRFEVTSLWPGAQVVVGRGKDGADRALLDEIDPAWVARRFGAVVIGSGDGIFAGLASDLRLRGVRVTVVARSLRSCSRRLARFAQARFLLDEGAEAEAACPPRSAA